MRLQSALFLRLAAAAAATALGLSAEAATTTFDFEGASPLANSIVGGSKANFVSTTDHALSGTQGLKFQDNTPEAYESWTYTLPAGFQTGTIEFWFRSDIDAAPLLPADSVGGSFLIESVSDPSDWAAIEISNSTFGPYNKFWGTEGSQDRLLTGAGNKFDSNSFIDRDALWHKVTLTIASDKTLLSIDASTPDEVAGPGTNGGANQLRFRHLAASPSNFGGGNWYSAPNPTSPYAKAVRSRVFIDDFVVTEATPTASTKTIGFEVATTADFDVAAVQSVAPKNDIAEQAGFVNVFRQDTTPANVHTGSGSATFDPGTKRLRYLSFDLTGATPGTATIKFYDAIGSVGANDKFGGAVVLQSGITPSTWIAAEIWNFGFPVSSDPTPGAYNYFFSKSTSPTAATFISRYFGDRSIGWHTVTINLGATSSTILVDGIENSNGAGVQTGPGLDQNPKILLLADSSSEGGAKNFVGLDELEVIYADGGTTNDTPYVYWDDVTVPVGSTSVTDWSVF